ncbi:hypothetical protein BJ912DRAFT_110456 [Pholiota molesta]|nr:hypothetical protein BJ912DRAFT_110456 [Pholiota molesta]
MATSLPGSPSTDAEILVKALRNVISTLRPSDGEDIHDANQDNLGPDGEQFVVALQKFISSFLRSQRGPVGGIEVDLEEKGTDVSISGSQATTHPKDVVDTALEAAPATDSSALEENTSQELLGLVKVPNEESPDMTVISIEGSSSISHTDGFEQRRSHFIDKALNALREHVFNTMPIRLLCFKPARSKLRLTLIERGEIYDHIASKLVRGIDSLRVSVNGESEQDLREILHSWYPSEDAAQTANAIDSGAEEAERMVLEGLIKNYSGYAILSHTWLRGDSREVTYGDWIRSEFDPHSQEPGCRKLVNFCRTAWKDYRVAFGWMDTVCINKESSAELDESIRSMYKWYQGTHVCITYLAETVAHSDIPKDTWFTRGWTLQELLAPSNIKFYNADWDKFVDSLESDKDNLIITKKIEEATTITADELQQDISNILISRRMQIAAKRQVTREEDSAYSLMGIFDAVLNSTSKGIADIFNWAGPNHSQVSALLPSSPQHYLDRASILGQRHIKAKPIEPIMLTHLGLRIAILLMPAIPTLHSRQSPLRDYHGIAYISTHHERDPRSTAEMSVEATVY